MSSVAERHCEPLSPVDTLWAVVVAAVTLIVFGPFSTIGVDAYHDGFMFKPSLDVAFGQRLFLETESMYGAFTIYLHALAIRLLGPNVWALKIDTLLSYALYSGFIYWAWRSILPRSTALLAMVVWWLLPPFYYKFEGYGGHFFPWTSVHSLALQAVGLCLFLKAINEDKTQLWFWTGVIGQCVVWSRQPVGLVFFGAQTFTLLAMARHERSYKKVVQFFAGHAAFLSLFLAIHFAIGSFRQVFEQSFTQLIPWYKNYSPGNSFGAANIIRKIFSPHSFGWRAMGALFLAVLLPASFQSKKISSIALISMMALGLASLLSEGLAGRVHTEFQLSFQYGSRIAVLAIGVSLSIGLLLFSSKRLASLVVIFLSAIGALHQVVPWDDCHHIFWAISLSIGPFLWMVITLSRNRAITNTALLLICLTVSLITLQKAIPRLQGFDEKGGERLVKLSYPSNLSGIWVATSEAERWNRFAHTIEWGKTHGGTDRAVLIGIHALFLTTSPNLSNPGGHWAYRTYTDESHWLSSVEDTLRSRSALVLVDTNDPTPFVKERLGPEFGFSLVETIPEWHLEIYSPVPRS
ncbi:MAG: hypothetical protein HYR96_08515 [Deltaproteobacteria bacterium]|nr:hypothetical protein [Deltaproteobacteria bacterium]MBI3294654.1 hypothetical protein [Deltaproteobacteria bacterium]